MLSDEHFNFVKNLGIISGEQLWASGQDYYRYVPSLKLKHVDHRSGKITCSCHMTRMT